MTPELTVIGGGLAGCEAAWHAAECGVKVRLVEMRPVRATPAHQTDRLAELVCSNSLRSDLPEQPAGLLKAEMRKLGSLILRCADAARVPGGGALTVDRGRFAEGISQAIASHPCITLAREEITEIPSSPAVVASGPLTSEALAVSIRSFFGEEFLSFYDAISPIVEGDSIDRSKVFAATRYGEGEASYLNCPMTEEQYRAFWEAIRGAERHEAHGFDDVPYFEGCLPIEVMADRGIQTLAFGPMRPVGLIDPRSGKRPYAVVQLRPENVEGTLYNLVGFQTRMKWGEQKRVFQTVPGLESAEFVRFGSIHRNTFLKSPRVLRPTYQSGVRDDLFFAGQLTGVEGYIESAASGIVAGINAARRLRGEPATAPPRETMTGALAHYITTANADHFQPMNANFGLLPLLPERVRDRTARNRQMADRALESLDRWAKSLELAPA